jgi:hypothetical protein
MTRSPTMTKGGNLGVCQAEDRWVVARAIIGIYSILNRRYYASITGHAFPFFIVF